MDVNGMENPKWIWCGDCDDDAHVWAWARREFVVSTESQAKLEITADLRYDLWLNGEYVGFGPPRYHAGTPTVDCYGLQDRLKVGKNVMAIRVYSCGGAQLSSCMPKRGALWLRLSTQVDTIISDGSWRMRRDPAYLSVSAARGETQPSNECYDARLSLGNVESCDFDCSDWACARELDGESGDVLENRDIPFFSAQPHAPDNLLECGILDFARSYSSLSIGEVAGEIRNAACRPLECGARLTPDDVYGVRLPHVSGEWSAVYAVWDLGRVWTGYPRLVLNGPAGVIVDVCYGEHLTDGRVDPSKSGINYFDRVLLASDSLEHQITWPKSARYVQIVVHGGWVDAKLTWVRSFYPLERVGSWSSSSPVIDHAVEISLHTVQLCMEDTYMDTPWRERGAWLGDDLIKARASYLYFGDFQLARRFLLHHSRGQESSGEMLGKYPSNVPHWVSTWSLRYPDSLLAYCLASDDWLLARQVWPTITKLVGWIFSRRDANGLLIGPDVTVTAEVNRYNFIDWAPVDMRGANAAWNAFAYRALTAAAKMASLLGEEALGGGWAAEADLLKAAFQKYFWNEALGVFVNGYHEGRQLSRWGSHENTLALLYGLATPSQRESILRRLREEDLQSVFVVNEADYDQEVAECGKLATVSLALSRYRWPEDRMVPIGTAYFAGYWLEMLSKYGLVEEAQKFIEERWGEFGRQGATTVWETWTMKESLSHGWSCSPAVFAAECFAGIQRSGATGLSYQVLPSPGKIRSLRSRVSTRLGAIQVVLNEGRLRVDKPEGVDVVAGLPCGSSDALYCDGVEVKGAASIERGGIVYRVHALEKSGSVLTVVAKNVDDDLRVSNL